MTRTIAELFDWIKLEMILEQREVVLELGRFTINPIGFMFMCEDPSDCKANSTVQDLYDMNLGKVIDFRR